VSRDDLFVAIDEGDAETVRRLLAAEPGLAAEQDDTGASAVRPALYRGRRDIAELILAASSPLEVFDLAALGHTMELHTLLESEPELVHARSGDGFTALHFAAFLGGADAVEVLLDAGADVAAVSTGAMTVQPLHSAAASGDVDAVRSLLQGGADPDAKQGGGYTALHEAAMNGRTEMAQALLDAGADPTIRADDGRDASDFARDAGHVDLSDRLA
jgi:ankyrin repeat protein